MDVKFLELTESIVSTKYLKNYLDKNCPEPKWIYDVACPKHKMESYKYPDGSPSDWFMVKSYLFITTTQLSMGKHEIVVRTFLLDAVKNWVTLKENYVFCFCAERYKAFGKLNDPVTDKDRKIMTVSMRNIMRKASTIKSVKAVERFFASAERNDFESWEDM